MCNTHFCVCESMNIAWWVKFQNLYPQQGYSYIMFRQPLGVVFPAENIKKNSTE